MEYLLKNRIVLKNLKLENIQVDLKMHLEITDFKKAEYFNPNWMRGYNTYQSLEISQGMFYDGYQTDIFTIGIILFVSVNGFQPFTDRKNLNYRLLTSTNPINVQNFWTQAGLAKLSDEFKDLFS
jgi:serine/threonine protein kinase